MGRARAARRFPMRHPRRQDATRPGPRPLSPRHEHQRRVHHARAAGRSREPRRGWVLEGARGHGGGEDTHAVVPQRATHGGPGCVDGCGTRRQHAPRVGDEALRQGDHDPGHPRTQRRPKHRRGAERAGGCVRRGEERRARRDRVREPGSRLAVCLAERKSRRRGQAATDKNTGAGVGGGADEDTARRGEGGDGDRPQVPDDDVADGRVRGSEPVRVGQAEAPEGAGLRRDAPGRSGSEARRGHQRQGLRDVQAEGQRRRRGPGHRARGIAREE
mmetsp:Transcript_12810/g.51462  ORF Transcript_12810/g.51462 Transcript_12810/m.51462 type:complete len:274 (+) Transcript_12810:404-1225(+)